MRLNVIFIGAAILQIALSFRRSFLDNYRIRTSSTTSYDGAIRFKLYANEKFLKSNGLNRNAKVVPSPESKFNFIFKNNKNRKPLVNIKQKQSSFTHLMNRIKTTFDLTSTKIPPISSQNSHSSRSILKNTERNIILFDMARSASVVCVLASIGYYFAFKTEQRKARRVKIELQKQVEYKEVCPHLTSRTTTGN